MKREKILIIGAGVKETKLSNELKKYFYNVETSNDTLNDVLKIYSKQNPDIVITPMYIRNSNVLSIIRDFKAILNKMPLFVVVSDVYDKYSEELTRDLTNIKFISSDFTATEFINLLDKDADKNKSKNMDSCTSREYYGIVTNAVKNIGIPTNVKGYNFLREAVMICINSKGLTFPSYTTGLCDKIAQKYKTTRSNVDRLMRHAIEIAYNDNGFLREKVHKRPTNYQLISALADKIKVEFCF